MTWQEILLAIPVPVGKRVSKIDCRLCVEDATGTVNIADNMLQGGTLAVIWFGHVSEARFSFEV
ncbi:MAG: hypothetical protein ACLKAK_07345 [Alkaliphilus sp.]